MTASDQGRSLHPAPDQQDAPFTDLNDLWQQTLHWLPNPNQSQQFQTLYRLILDGNQKLNLTRITEPTEFWEKHLWDSLRGILELENLGAGHQEGAPQNSDLEPQYSAAGIATRTDLNPTPAAPLPTDVIRPQGSQTSPFRVIDIGTGAGFPGIPVAIAHPHWDMTLLDSTRKKVAFLESILPELGLSNARTWVGRVEDIGQHPQHRGHYDMALLRAVAPASVCAEYALPLLKRGGYAVLYRGQWTDADTESLAAVVELLGGAIAHIDAFETPISHSVRHCILLKKIAKTPVEFPRPAGMPAKDPL